MIVWNNKSWTVYNDSIVSERNENYVKDKFVEVTSINSTYPYKQYNFLADECNPCLIFIRTVKCKANSVTVLS